MIPLALVGCGKIARDQHIPAIAASPDFDLVAIADPAVEVTGLPTFAEPAPMFAARPEIAAVALCMPPRFRAGAAREAIAAGKHVLLEKPPCASMAEARALETLARGSGVTLFAAWHSQQGAGLARARDWLAGQAIRAVRVNWKEDARVWHPGQPWIWQDGGFGVFDPGINALSILTALLPGTLQLTDAELAVPANCATPITARLEIAGEGFPVTAEFDFRQTGPQSWDVEIATAAGFARLSHGGNRLEIDGQGVEAGREAEYPALYARFAALIGAGESEVDLEPLRLTEAALTLGRVTTVEPFEEFA
jgi:predicted dehydrogenase